MPQELPNLAGVATKDLVEQIGTGSFSASYINWSRTLNLLRTNAPGWVAECVYDVDGSILHKAPVGAYLLIRFKHIDGTTTPEVPQAVMDHRNNAIPYDKITARDITDTQRRGTCLAAAFTFGLAYELWAKMPLETGYAAALEANAPEPEIKKKAPAAATEAKFEAAAKKAGLSELAIDMVKKAIKGNWEAGIKTLASKTKDEITALNEKAEAA